MTYPSPETEPKTHKLVLVTIRPDSTDAVARAIAGVMSIDSWVAAGMTRELPIVLLEGLGRSQARAIANAMNSVTAAGATLEVTERVDPSTANVCWPDGAPLVDGSPLDAFGPGS